MISYEVSIGLILISVLVCVGSLNFIDIILYQNYIVFAVPFFPLFLMFLVSILAETNRAPFDLPEAESELVSGFNVEYASMGFALFFSRGVWFYYINEYFFGNYVSRWLVIYSFAVFSRPFRSWHKSCFCTFLFHLSARFFSALSY